MIFRHRAVYAAGVASAPPRCDPQFLRKKFRNLAARGVCITSGAVHRGANGTGPPGGGGGRLRRHIVLHETGREMAAAAVVNTCDTPAISRRNQLSLLPHTEYATHCCRQLRHAHIASSGTPWVCHHIVLSYCLQTMIAVAFLMTSFRNRRENFCGR